MLLSLKHSSNKDSRLLLLSLPSAVEKTKTVSLMKSIV